MSRKGRKGPELAPAGDWEISGNSFGRERKEGRVCHLEEVSVTRWRQESLPKADAVFHFVSVLRRRRKIIFRKISCPRLFSLFLHLMIDALPQETISLRRVALPVPFTPIVPGESCWAVEGAQFM